MEDIKGLFAFDDKDFRFSVIMCEQFSLNYQPHKIGISADHFLLFISFVKLIVVIGLVENVT